MCNRNQGFYSLGHIDWFNNPIPAPDAFEEGNMANISPTVKIDISIKPGIVEEITIGVHAPLKNSLLTKLSFRNTRIFFPGHIWRCLSLDPSIVEHRIDTWPDVTPVRQKQHPLHPSKVVAIKDEIDKLRIVGFIYPIVYTSWVSNPIPVNKK
jgi:hypothetical protein